MHCAKINCGGGHTVAIMETGETYSWGQGFDGQLGTGFRENMFSPQKIIIPNDKYSNFLDSSCGSKHTVLITEFGQVLVFGHNEYVNFIF